MDLLCAFGSKLETALPHALLSVGAQMCGMLAIVRHLLRFSLIMAAFILFTPASLGTTKGLSQIVTPDLEDPGDLSLSFQAQSDGIGNPYEIQTELGLTKWAEVALFKGFQPDDWILGTEIGLIQKEPWLLSIGAVNWSPKYGVNPQPFIEAGYYTEHHKFIVGGIHVGYRQEAILGYAYDYNKTWRAQVDFQSGSGNSVTAGFTCNITRDLQFNPALYLTNDSPHKVYGYIVFTYTFHLWGKHDAASPKSEEEIAGLQK
jgi:hypothetical protein